MGFLIFAFRKLTLRQDINRKQFRLMGLSTDLQRIQQQASVLQQAQGMMQDAWGVVSGSISNASQSLFQLDQSASQMQLNKAQSEYNNAIKCGDAKALEAAKLSYEKAMNDSKNQQVLALGLQGGVQAANLAVNQAVNSVFDAATKYQLQTLHLKEQRITAEKNSLESQVKLETAELSEVEKAEDQAAKDSAPKFGLS